MIIRQNKSYEISSSFPNTNFYPNENNYVVEDGTSLAQKIIENAPNFDFVLDADGNLIDITPTGKPLDLVKEEKIKELDNACNQTIENGFDYTINNISYHFFLPLEAQSNFQGARAQFKDNKITVARWTVLNNSTGQFERIDLDWVTFEPIADKVFDIVDSNIRKFRDTLEPQVKSSTTTEEVNAITW